MRFFAACALAAALCCCTASAANIEIDPSVLLSGTSDYSGTDGQARCQGMVNRANALTQSTIMFVPTLFWVSEVRAADATVNSQRCAQVCAHSRRDTCCCITAQLQCQVRHCRCQALSEHAAAAM